jgi:hypothetical protein
MYGNNNIRSDASEYVWSNVALDERAFAVWDFLAYSDRHIKLNLSVFYGITDNYTKLQKVTAKHSAMPNFKIHAICFHVAIFEI